MPTQELPPSRFRSLTIVKRVAGAATRLSVARAIASVLQSVFTLSIELPGGPYVDPNPKMPVPRPANPEAAPGSPVSPVVAPAPKPEHKLEAE